MSEKFVTLFASKLSSKKEKKAIVVSENNSTLTLKIEGEIGLVKFNKQTGLKDGKQSNDFPAWKIKDA